MDVIKFIDNDTHALAFLRLSIFLLSKIFNMNLAREIAIKRVENKI